jgi:hypothetical protein
MEAEKRGGTSGPLDLGKLSNHVLSGVHGFQFLRQVIALLHEVFNLWGVRVFQFLNEQSPFKN